MNNDRDHRKPLNDIETGSDAMEDAYRRASPGPDSVEDNRDRATEKKIDKALKETFPASDPPSAMPGAD